MGDDATAADNAWFDEVARLRGLYALDLIDGVSSDRFDRFTRIAQHTFDAPVAHVTLLDESTQWFCSVAGDDRERADRSESFCTHLIDTEIDLLVVEDTHSDERFSGLGFVIGEPFVRFYAGAPVSSPDGHRIGTICVLDFQPREFGERDRLVLRDLAALVENELHQLALSTTDELTGLPNLRAFRATAHRFMLLGERRDEPLTVMFADVDGLKRINDEFGHADGDDLLRQAASVLRASIRSSDLVARVGGDEFAIVAYGLQVDQTTRIVAAIEAAVAASNRDTDAADLLSISVGTATSARGESVDELIERADAAMYDAKRDRAGSRSPE